MLHLNKLDRYINQIHKLNFLLCISVIILKLTHSSVFLIDENWPQLKWVTLLSFLLVNSTFFYKANTKNKMYLLTSSLSVAILFNIVDLAKTLSSHNTLETISSYMSALSIIFLSFSIAFYHLAKKEKHIVFIMIPFTISLLAPTTAGLNYLLNFSTFEESGIHLAMNPVGIIIFSMLAIKLLALSLEGELSCVFCNANIVTVKARNIFFIFLTYNALLFFIFSFKKSNPESDTLLFILVTLYFCTMTFFSYLIHLSARKLNNNKKFIQLCAWSKKIKYRNEWISIEQYLMLNQEVEITHGISPDAKNEMIRKKQAS